MSTILDRQGLNDAVDIILVDVKDELVRAVANHGRMHGPHEGYAVIKEELDELWDEVKKKRGGRDVAAAKEALQLAAMACRYLLEVVDSLPA
jgi:hypothetical protein